MNKIIFAPDSFKGTMSSLEICDIMEGQLARVFPECQAVKLPIADGGEGTVEAMLSASGGERIELDVTGPDGRKIRSFYGLINDGTTAVIEMAAAAGLPLVRGREDPSVMTTYGVGQLILDAAQRGVGNILLGLGGSCTNDGGCGAAAALGVTFTDADGRQFIPSGGSLKKICAIDLSPAKELLKNISIRIMCDVDNPLYGPRGAAYIFGPQKGADEKMVAMLDSGLMHLGCLLEKLCPGVSDMPGAGAAGGMGAGMTAMLGARLVSGIDGVLDAIGFEELLDGCDMIFTGEGRIDSQSLHGKVVSGICRRAKVRGVPVCAVVGDALDDQLSDADDIGLCGVFTINRKAVPVSLSRLTARADLAALMHSIFTFAAACSGDK